MLQYRHFVVDGCFDTTLLDCDDTVGDFAPGTCSAVLFRERAFFSAWQLEHSVYTGPDGSLEIPTRMVDVVRNLDERCVG